MSDLKKLRRAEKAIERQIERVQGKAHTKNRRAQVRYIETLLCGCTPHAAKFGFTIRVER